MRLYDSQWDPSIEGDLVSEGGPHGPLLVAFGVSSLLVIIVVIGLCSCFKSSADDSEKTKKGKDIKRKKNVDLKVNVGLHPDTDIEVDIITPQSNGSVGTATSHDRPKSHDRALPEIPAIGATNSRPGDEDDEDDNDGLYDVISKRPKHRQHHAHANGSVKQKALSPLPQNPYELVPETASSSERPAEIDPISPIYATSSKVLARASQQSSPRLSRMSEYDTKDDNSVFYAAPQKKRHSYERVKDVAAVAIGGGASSPKLGRDTESVNTLNISVNSGPAPPVPTKQFIPEPGSTDVCIHGDPSLVLPSGNLGNVSPGISGNPVVFPGNITSNSPSPSRHLHTNSVTSDSGLPIASSSSCGTSSHQSQGPLTHTPPQPQANGQTSGAMASGETNGYHGNGTGSGAAGPAKKEPPYHKVTVRESLANVRLREAEERRRKGLPPDTASDNPLVGSRLGLSCVHSPALVLMPGSSTDVDYDQINYDQIKSPGATGGTSGGVGGDTGSELYAEIGGAEAPSSTRSSTYAAVGEGSALCAAQSPPSDHAPTPPPVDSLKQITETLDPGYSQIGVPHRGHHRPHSTISSGSSGHYDNAPGPMASRPPGGSTTMTTGPGNSAVYSEVRKKRSTVHAGENLEQSLAGVSPEELQLMYAKVNKPKRGGGSSSIGVSNNGMSISNTGARPKVLQGNPQDPGYSMIAGASSGAASQMRKTDGDYYEVVEDNDSGMLLSKNNTSGGGEETESEYDPNYERMGNVARVPMEENSATSQKQDVKTPPGVAREILPTGGAAIVDSSLNEQGMVHVSYNNQSKPSIFDRPGLIREHIYQEIPDNNKPGSSQRGKKGKDLSGSKETGAKKKGQGRKDNIGAGGNSGGSKKL